MRYLNMLVGRLKIEALSTTISPRIINMRPLQKSPSPNSRNLNKGFLLLLFQISTDSTQISP